MASTRATKQTSADGAYGDLARESAKRSPVEEIPKRLSLDDVHTDEDVFQHRDHWSYQSDYHARELTQALKEKPPEEDLEPIVVWWSGERWYCIDGHHRLKAYQAVEERESIPVAAFDGSLDEAILKALGSNSQPKLQMTKQEKLNAAWKIVRIGVGSKAQQAQASGVSDRTIGNMRSIKKELLKEHPEEPLPDCWGRALMKSKGLESDDLDDVKIDEVVADVTQRLQKEFGPYLRNKPDIFWSAIEAYDQNLYQQMYQRPIAESEEILWDE